MVIEKDIFPRLGWEDDALMIWARARTHIFLTNASGYFEMVKTSDHNRKSEGKENAVRIYSLAALSMSSEIFHFCSHTGTSKKQLLTATCAESINLSPK